MELGGDFRAGGGMMELGGGILELGGSVFICGGVPTCLRWSTVSGRCCRVRRICCRKGTLLVALEAVSHVLSSLYPPTRMNLMGGGN